MHNPYSNHPQSGNPLYSENRSPSYAENRSRSRNERWNADDYSRGNRPSWREDNSNRSRNRSAWGEEQRFGQAPYGGANYTREPAYSRDENRYERGWQANRGGAFNDEDDYGYYGYEMQGGYDTQGAYDTRGDRETQNPPSRRQYPFNEDYENYGANQDYHLGNAPSVSRYHYGEAGHVPSWQQTPSRPSSRSYGRAYEGDSGNFGYRPQWSRSEQNFSSNRPGDNSYDDQQGGSQPRAQTRSEFSSAGAYGLQQSNYRGKGPKGYTRTDERIREDICECLSDDPHINASEISVEVRNGIVTLDGSVDDRNQKHRIEDIADSVSGVKDVHNGLRVQRQQQTASSSLNTLSSSSESNAASQRETATKATKQ